MRSVDNFLCSVGVMFTELYEYYLYIYCVCWCCDIII